MKNSGEMCACGSVPQSFPDLKTLLTNPALYQDEGPFCAQRLSELFDGLADERGLLLAVSGGADSLALLLYCYAWQIVQGGSTPLYIATIDHCLRPESAAETAYIGRLSEHLGLSHRVFRWTDKKPESGLEAKARDIRYGFLSAYARELGVCSVLTAHHHDDQLETFFMRLFHGSGLAGLGGMRRRQQAYGIEVVRPLLCLRKSELRKLLEVFGLDWCEDRSNQDERFERVRFRKNLVPVVERFVVNPHWLQLVGKRLLRAEEALVRVTQDLFDHSFRAEAGRALSCELDWFCCQADEFRNRLLQKAILHVLGPSYPCKDESLSSLDRDLCLHLRSDEKSDLVRGKVTLGGCCFEIKVGRLWIYRELGRRSFRETFFPGQGLEWAGLYNVSVSCPKDSSVLREGSIVLQPLGSQGRLALGREGIVFEESRYGSPFSPKALVEALPSLWHEGQVFAVVNWPEVVEKSVFSVDFIEKNTQFSEKPCHD